MTEKDFDFWIENNLNVIFRGKAGCGKTARILEALNKHGIKYKYFSASTIDPWVDFVGIPKEKHDDDGRSYISFIRPREIEYDEVEVLVFDEFNRASKKVLNAVMELLQFKSINGKKLGNLRFIWAAVNMNEGDEETYSVEKIDPAQLDRFQVHVDVPYQLDKQYFKKKFGEDVFFSANEWWKGLTDKIRDTVSPRRVDYALDTWKANGNIAYVIPKGANPYDLINRLSTGSYEKQFDSLMNENSTEKWKTSMSDINFCDWILKNADKAKVSKNIMLCLPYFSDELISSIIQQKSKNTEFLEEAYKNSKFKGILEQIINAKTASTKIVRSLTTFYNSKVPKEEKVAMTPKMVGLYNSIYSQLTTTGARKKEALNFTTIPLITPEDCVKSILTMYVIKKRTQRMSFVQMFPNFSHDITQLKGALALHYPTTSVEYKVLSSFITECENFHY